MDLEDYIKVYPNPSRGVFTLSTNYEFGTNVRIVVYDVLGRKILKSSIVLRKSKIDLSGHRGGIYHLQVVTDSGVVNKKVVVE